MATQPGAKLGAPSTTARIPRATYRVQLHSDFTLADATALVPYLAALGISHLYTSPVLRARAGSRHGYDIVDHAAINPELGDEASFDALVAALHAHSMGWLLDIVPNHMGVLGGDNAWWQDVLAHGPASPHADFFDIDWVRPDPALHGKVLLPLLGDQYGLVLERGELTLGLDAGQGSFVVSYYEHRLPIDPQTYPALLDAVQPRLPDEVPAATWAALRDAFAALPTRHAAADHPAPRHAAQAAHKQAFAALLSEHPALQTAIDQTLDAYNQGGGTATPWGALDALLEAQAWRLANWRVAADEINYRRFFDINELAALRMERPEVFDATHARVLDWTARGAVDGLRIDHPDGLADPAGYFARLQAAHAQRTGQDAETLPLYVVIEKITAPHERLPADWPVHGTTGYRYANVINGVLIDPRAKARLDRAWRAFAGDEAHDFDTLAREGRRLVMAGPLAGELNVLAAALLRLARADWRTRDFTLALLHRALAEVLAAFPVYRTYVIDTPSAQDRQHIDWAVGRAQRRSQLADASVFDFLRRVMLGEPLPDAPAGLAQRYLAVARRLQQYSAPVAAKGIEDTAFYRHQRLISVNDVGGEPDQFGFTLRAFHAASQDRATHWPHTMLATSTHDAKRSEDVRARIDVLSELAPAWRLTARRWSRLNRRHRVDVEGVLAPSRDDEYLLYQTLLGSLPADAGVTQDDAAMAAYAERVAAAMLKSARESKAVTSWINPHAAYEAALTRFVHAVLSPQESRLFLDDLQTTVAISAWYGALNGLTLALVKTLSPGVPDFYQGHETIELSLVDPDNRRPVDYALRRAWLAEVQATDAAPQEERLADLAHRLLHARDGRAKFWLTWRALQCRQRHDALLRDGSYLPLTVRGARADHVLAFARRAGTQWLVVVAARLYASLGLDVGALPIGDVWGDTVVVWPAKAAPPAVLQDKLTGVSHTVQDGVLRVADLLRHWPAAALFGDSAGSDIEFTR